MKTDQQLEAAKHDKKCVDESWERLYKEVQNGVVDIERIVLAMDQCNRADSRFCHLTHVENEYQARKNEIRNKNGR